MKKALKFLASRIWIVVILITTLSCGFYGEDDAEDLFYISSNTRNKVRIGVNAISKNDKDQFYTKLEALVEKCNSFPVLLNSSVKPYMETKEYEEFKSFIVSASPESYYLLIEIFLKGDNNIGPFSYMFQDIVEATYPGLISRVLDALEDTSVEDFIVAYPQTCVEYLLIEMQK